MANAMEVGKKLVDLCRQNKIPEVINTLYSPHIVSIEAHASPAGPARLEGIAAVKAKNEWWMTNHQIHSFHVDGPWPNGDRFIVTYDLEVTAKAGPMAGQRMKMKEAGLYTVKDGKITQEEFFYEGGG